MKSNPDGRQAKAPEGVEQLVRSAAEGEADHYAGKRHDTRVCENVPLELTDDPAKKSAAVTMHNISKTGCAFWIKRKLEIHATVYVREFTPDNSAKWIRGYVTHCTQGIRGFLVGVAFGNAP